MKVRKWGGVDEISWNDPEKMGLVAPSLGAGTCVGVKLPVLQVYGLNQGSQNHRRRNCKFEHWEDSVGGRGAVGAGDSAPGITRCNPKNGITGKRGHNNDRLDLAACCRRPNRLKRGNQKAVAGAIDEQQKRAMNRQCEGFMRDLDCIQTLHRGRTIRKSFLHPSATYSTAAYGDKN